MEGARNLLCRAQRWLRDRAKYSIADRLGGDVDQRADSLALAKSLVVAKKESVVLANRPPSGCPELVPPELRDRGGIKVVPRIQRTVAQELIRVAVEGIRS